MCKIIVAAIGLLAVLHALTASPIDRDACSSEAVEYLKAFEVDPSLQVLADETKRFYPQVEKLVGQPPSEEFMTAVIELGPQPSCEQLIWHINDLDLKVPCFSERFDAAGMAALMQTDASVKPVIETYYACLASVSFTMAILYV